MSPISRDRIAFVAAVIACTLAAAISLRPLGVFFFTIVRHYGFLLALALTLPTGVLGLTAVGALTYDVIARLLGEHATVVAERRGMRISSLVAASAFLTVASVGVPERVHDPADLNALAFGLPVPYLLQSPSYHSYGHPEGVPLPAWVSSFSPLEHGSDIRWWALGLDVLVMFGLCIVTRRAVSGEGRFPKPDGCFRRSATPLSCPTFESP